jgi:protein tyrosine/serine phosphatase
VPVLRRLLLLLVVLAPGASSLSWSATVDASDTYPQDCNPTFISDQDIQNFHEVDAVLFRGARPRYDADVYLKLAELGVRTIVNLEGRGEARKEHAAVERANQRLREKNRPALVFISFPIRSFFRTVLFSLPDKRVQSLFAQIQSAPKPIFIHCKHGKDRTGAMVALYRLKRLEQRSVQAALREARYYKFSKWNFGLKRTVNRYKKSAKLNELPPPSPDPAHQVCMPAITKMAAAVPLP